MGVIAAPRGDGVLAHGRNRIAYQLLADQPASELLDYGCGSAHFALAAARELGLTVHACDIDSSLIEQLQDEHGVCANFFSVSDSDPQLELADGQVSIVTCCEVLEHMPKALRSAALREMCRVLADDGMLVITTPHRGLLSPLDPENFKHDFPRVHRLAFTLFKGREKYRERYRGKRFGNYSNGAMRHLHFSRAQLAEELEAAGFRVEEVRYYALVYPLARTVLWLSESLARRVRGLGALAQACWRLYVWDSDLEPGRLATSIAIRARKAAPAGAWAAQAE